MSGYRHRVFDKKLAKMGMHQLMAEGSDWDESAANSRAGSRAVSRPESPSPTRGEGKKADGDQVCGLSWSGSAGC